MKTLKVLSALMSYPQPEILAALPEMNDVVVQENLLPRGERKAVLAMIDRLGGMELMPLQEQYVALFDRGRALSLHLFEHVHGESRDRGQAMVDLIGLYKSHGFEINARELPDYIPLFLEYLSQRPMDEARELLGDAMHVLSLIGARLKERGSPYHVLFDALEAFAGKPEHVAAIREQARTEGPDATVVDMDKIWEEEAVTFMATNKGDCGTQASATVQWMPRQSTKLR